MAERAFIDSQVDKFLKDLVKIYDNNKDDERRKFKDLSTRYDDLICKKVNDQAPSTIFEMLRNPAGGASTPVDNTIQFKPNMFTPQAKPGHHVSQGFMQQQQHGDPMGGSTMSGFYQAPHHHHQQPQHGYPQQQQHHQPQHGSGRFPQFDPRMNRHGGPEPNMDYMPMRGNLDDSLLGGRPSGRGHSPMQYPHHQQQGPLGQIPTAYSSIENFHHQQHDGRLGRNNFNFPVPPQNPSKPISQEDILKRNIELLGGLEPSLDFMESSLKDNELRHYNVNAAHAPRGGHGRDISPGGSKLRLDSASPIRNTYHQESDYTPYMQGHAPPRFGTGQLPMPQQGHGGHGGYGQQFAGHHY